IHRRARRRPFRTRARHRPRARRSGGTHAGAARPPAAHERARRTALMQGDNERWLSRSRAAVWHPCTQMKVHETLPLVPVARGEGPWLIDFEGRRYLDAVSSWWVNLFGHRHPRINAAIKAQLD